MHFDLDYNSSTNNEIYTNVKRIEINKANSKAIATIQSFSNLNENWDSYGAEVPTNYSIIRAINFVTWLSQKQIDVYFTIPLPDGGILIELKENNASLEIEFAENENEKDSITANYEDEVNAEDDFNDTTRDSYLRWLICPDGNCPGDL